MGKTSLREPEGMADQSPQQLWPESIMPRELWLQSCLLSDTYIGREKAARFLQYFARMVFGITDWEFFGNLLRALALSRKTLRFYKPVKAVKKIEDVKRDPASDELEKQLTIIEIGSDAVYAAIDHVTFVQRIGGMKWMSERQVDMLDRFLEFFWLSEVLPVIWREVRKLLRLRALAAKCVEDSKLAAIAEERAKSVKVLFKAAICDLPCTIYFMAPLAYKQKRANKAWCGFLGAFASAMSLHQNWPHGRCKGE